MSLPKLPSLLSLLMLMAVAACAPADTHSDRAPLGKADLVGSCQAPDDSTFCGGQSDGNCWCDDECSAIGDCCGDVQQLCAPLLCPDPILPTVHYVAEDSSVCLAADWACSDSQVEIDESCGCGCVDIATSIESPVCSLGNSLTDCCDFVVAQAGLYQANTGSAAGCAHLTFGLGTWSAADDLCSLQCEADEIVADMGPGFDDFRIACVAGCEAPALLECGTDAGLLCPSGLSCFDDVEDGCQLGGGFDCGGHCYVAACGTEAGLQCPSGTTCVDNADDGCVLGVDFDCDGHCAL